MGKHTIGQVHSNESLKEPGRYMIGLATLLSSIGFATCAAHSLTLREALVSTYNTNPTLGAARARLGASKELLARARARGRPNISASGRLSYDQDYVNVGQARSRTGNFAPRSELGVSLQQPLFRGFSIIHGIREAKAEIYAGHADLLQSEQEVLLSAVTAYIKAWRYQSFVHLQKLNVTALREQVVATTERRRIGEATATDVLQSEARLARAKSQFSQTEANLKSAYADFERIIDKRPVDLRRPNNTRVLLPKSLGAAERTAFEESPVILAAQRRRSASRHALNKVRGELLPRVDLEASYSLSNDDSRLTAPANGAALSARVVVPLYQGGDVRARVREATHVRLQRKYQAEEAKRQIKSTVRSAWHQLSSLESQITLNRKQVDASRVALLGLLEQEKRGQRTTTDVLNAQQDLTDAKIALVGSQADLTVSIFNLMSAMGRLNAIDLGFPLGN